MMTKSGDDDEGDDKRESDLYGLKRKSQSSRNVLDGGNKSKGLIFPKRIHSMTDLYKIQESKESHWHVNC